MSIVKCLALAPLISATTLRTIPTFVANTFAPLSCFSLTTLHLHCYTSSAIPPPIYASAPTPGSDSDSTAPNTSRYSARAAERPRRATRLLDVLTEGLPVSIRLNVFLYISCTAIARFGCEKQSFLCSGRMISNSNAYSVRLDPGSVDNYTQSICLRAGVLGELSYSGAQLNMHSADIIY